MAILNLDKIVLHRTVMGVVCPVCGGLLEAIVKNPNWFQKIIGKKRENNMRYCCQDCQRRYEMAQVP